MLKQYIVRGKNSLSSRSVACKNQMLNIKNGIFNNTKRSFANIRPPSFSNNPAAFGLIGAGTAGLLFLIYQARR